MVEEAGDRSMQDARIGDYASAAGRFRRPNALKHGGFSSSLYGKLDGQFLKGSIGMLGGHLSALRWVAPSTRSEGRVVHHDGSDH